MLNRLSNKAMVKVVAIVGAMLAILLFSSTLLAQSSSIPYPENGEVPVATFNATDQDGDAIVWSLGGDDKGDFNIDGGELNFKSPPDYEKPTSESTGTLADRNVYNVTVQATGGTHDVVVTVTNEDEDGTVSFTGLGQFQPQVGRSLEAELTDQDTGDTDHVWMWERSADGQAWTVIEGATSAKRSPAAADEGMYLRVSVTYRDIFGPGKTASKMTASKVEERTLSNALPSFADQDDDNNQEEAVDGIQVNRSVDENTEAGMNIGKAVSASDADDDILVYSLSGEVTIGGNPVDVTTLFSISPSNGQLKAKAMLDFENTAGNPSDNRYEVMVTATDPSGAAASQPVIITLMDVNEAPAFDTDDQADGNQPPPKVLNVVENTIALRVGADGTTALSPTAYAADDPDAEALDATGTFTLDVSGADAKYFDISATGALTIDQDTNDDDNNDHTVNFEAKSSYSITIVAMSGADNRVMRTRLDVTVHVIDAEDGGMVSLTQREPQIGRTVVATVSDPDGGVSLTRWMWATSNDIGDGETCAANANTWTDVIPDVSSGAYTPKEADDNKCLRATATYTDNIPGDSATDTADTIDNDNDDTTDANMDGIDVAEVSEKPVQASDPANTAPEFPDQDLTTLGDQSDEATRSVVENKAKENVGGQISATDENGDAMLYTLNGGDAASFKVDNNGQITTAVKLDYETKSEYMVALTATDPSGASDSILVTIMVTDENDDAVITGDDSIPYPENGEVPVATFNATDQDGDAIVWSLGGDDKGDFNIDGGELNFKSPPDYEKPTSESTGTLADRNVYNVTVQATGGTHDVVVTVTNEDEDGTVSFTGLGQFQPQVGRSLEAELTDQDTGDTDHVWMWERSADGQAWTVIEGATSAKRSPAAADEGMYLRVSVTYRDIFGRARRRLR